MAEQVKKEHSVPVPRLYKEAMKILERYENKEGSLKTLIYSSKYKNYKPMYALMSKALDNYSLIKTVLSECNLLTEQPRFNPSLAHVLTAELLGRGHLQGDSKPILVLNEYADKIKHLAGSRVAEAQLEEKKKGRNLRYVRINTLLSTVDRVHAQLALQGWKFVEYDSAQVTYDEFLEYIENLDESNYLQDYHVPDLLVFHHGAAFWDNTLYKQHKLVMQDKASCLPVFLSDIEEGAHVIDACAAPGNKTSLMAAIMNNIGEIQAFDRNEERYKLLLKFMAERGATCVTCSKKNFTKVSPDVHNNVDYIFLDPTCSSSGVNLHSDEVSLERVVRLASFQLQLLLHALSFPSVKKVIYSTCSVNVQENESVIEEALRKYGRQFYLEDLQQKLPGWKHFGNEKYKGGIKCIRTVSDEDKCQGFFVAIFIRKDCELSDTIEAQTNKKKRTAENDFSNNQEQDEEDSCSYLSSNNEGIAWNNTSNAKKSKLRLK